MFNWKKLFTFEVVIPVVVILTIINLTVFAVSKLDSYQKSHRRVFQHVPMKFFKDSETGLCFAFVETNYQFTTVNCSDVEKSSRFVQ